MVTGGVPLPGVNAWATNVVWGETRTPGGALVVWGAANPDNVVWSEANPDNVVWSELIADNVVWSESGTDNVVWGQAGATARVGPGALGQRGVERGLLRIELRERRSGARRSATTRGARRFRPTTWCGARDFQTTWSGAKRSTWCGASRTAISRSSGRPALD